MSQFNITSQTKPLIEFLKKNRQNQRFLKSVEIIATLVLIAFFSIFAILPTAKTISALLGDIESKKILVKSMRGKINQVVLAQDNFSQIQGKYFLIESSLPTSQRFYNAANQLQLSANYANLNTDSLSFALDTKTPTANLNLLSYSTSLSPVGDFLSLVNLVENIEKNRRVSYINSISLMPYTPPKNRGEDQIAVDPNATNISLNINFFYWPNGN